MENSFNEPEIYEYLKEIYKKYPDDSFQYSFTFVDGVVKNNPTMYQGEALGPSYTLNREEFDEENSLELENICKNRFNQTPKEILQYALDRAREIPKEVVIESLSVKNEDNKYDPVIDLTSIEAKNLNKFLTHIFGPH